MPSESPLEANYRPIETGVQHVAALQDRTIAVTESTLLNASASELAAGGIDVFVGIVISCSYARIIERNDCDYTEQATK